MSMSMFSVSPTVEHTRCEANSALPDAPVVHERTARVPAHRALGVRRLLARAVRHAARAQLAWACRLDVPGPAHR